MKTTTIPARRQAATPTPKPASAVRRYKKLNLTPYLFLAPSLFGVLAFLLLPVLIVAGVSLFKWELLDSPTFIGLENYRKLAGDGDVRHSLWVTVLYVLLSIPVQTVIALGLALLLNQKIRGVKFFRALFVVPWMATPIVMGVVWTWIFDPANGALNKFLGAFGVDGPNWLSDAAFALPAVAAVQVWQYAGYNMLFFLAGLQGIPGELYDAADTDGASKVRQFVHITLPLLNPTMFFVLVTNIIGSFQVYDTLYVMTEGGPDKSTEVLNFRIVQTAFTEFDFGYASAMAMLLFALILAFTVVQVRFFNRRTTYDIS
ncbi:carbohydrate ABC transporter permease [Streptomyces boninensis]|uniref:carbohydrate ABC transporter permease n=1 Tax=Streptomyces boninensis TaxID=2039455 RepID=UPI003B21360D